MTNNRAVVSIVSIGIIGFVMLGAITACEPEERETICANCVAFCPNEVCESLPSLPCDLVDQFEGDWPCPCVGPGLDHVEQDVPDGPGTVTEEV